MQVSVSPKDVNHTYLLMIRSMLTTTDIIIFSQIPVYEEISLPHFCPGPILRMG